MLCLNLKHKQLTSKLSPMDHHLFCILPKSHKTDNVVFVFLSIPEVTLSLLTISGNCYRNGVLLPSTIFQHNLSSCLELYRNKRF